MKQSTLASFFSKPAASGSAPAPKAAAPKPKPPTKPADPEEEEAPAEFIPSSSKPRHAARPTVQAEVVDDDEVAMEEDEEGAISSRGRKLGKRKVVIDDSSDDDAPQKPARPSSSASRSTLAASGPRPALAKPKKKPRYSGDSDDDDFIFDESSTAASAPADSDQESDMQLDTPETSRTSSAPKHRAKAQPAGKDARARPPLGSKTSSGGAGKALTKAQQAKQREKAETEERAVPWRFLKDIKDADKNPKGSPDYDPRTLYISPADWQEMTPFEEQFWRIKSKHADCVLFFQKGKFSELYEEDAFIGHQEFDLKITRRVKMSMVGVPSTSLEFWISKFLAKGYKVGRVDQSETALGAEMRSKGLLGDGSANAKSQKQKNGKEIVRRELKTVLSSGTVTDGSMLTDDGAQCLMVVKENVDSASGCPVFGLVMLDATTAEFSLCRIPDDVCRTKLETAIRCTRPKELVFEKGRLSPDTLRLLKSCTPAGCVWTGLKPAVEFIEPARCRQELETLLGDDVPETLRDHFDASETVEALGALWTYLTQLNLVELFTTRNFTLYDPSRRGQALVLDGPSLAHIEVLLNSEGGEEGTLLRLLDRTCTPFGKRLFRRWLTAPLQDIGAINARLDAVEDLMSNVAFEKEVTSLARGMPDLERLISRIHAGSVTVKHFRLVLASFRKMSATCAKLLALCADFRGSAVRDLLERAPDIGHALDEVEATFTGEGSDITPIAGHDALYDAALEEIAEAEAALDTELKAAEALLKCSCEFRDIGIKDIRQIQVPVKVKAKIPKDWTKMSSTKEFDRYYTPRSMKLIRALKEAREREAHAKEEFHLRVFEKFDASYHELWLPTVKLVSKIDCLVSLAKASAALGDDACRPVFVDSPLAFLDFRDLRHPCAVASEATGDLIPNDVSIGDQSARTILLSGPNMAGKSTLLRATCVAVICAQLGCFVAASSARLSPVDRIQTRMGASDSIFTGSSTFKVEMDDARKTIMESTPRSLVVLDELGRGTSTHDGHAIAFAVLHSLATHVHPLTFFATHYNLAPDFVGHPDVAPMFMSTALEDGRLCFLYKLKPGSAARSFGPMVARLAGVPAEICDRATHISEEFEEATHRRRQATRGKEALSLCLQADAAWLVRQATDDGLNSAARLQHRLLTLASIRKAARSLCA